MEILQGEQLRIENLATAEGGKRQVVYLYVHDIWQRRGQIAILAHVASHEVKVVRGYIPVGARISSPVILPAEPSITAHRLSLALGGLPLVLRKGTELVLPVNTDSKCRLWQGLDPKNPKDHQTKCARLIDYYFELKDSGQLDKLPVRPDMHFDEAGRFVAIRNTPRLWYPGQANGTAVRRAL